MKIGTILRSPLLHFFVLGGLVFGFYAVTAPPEARAPRDDVLRLTEAEMNRMADSFLAAWGRAPTEAESRGLVRDWAIEEVMVREALALGLDKDDAMIRNRLRTKMEFLAEAPAAATHQPTAAAAPLLGRGPLALRRWVQRVEGRHAVPRLCPAEQQQRWKRS